MPKENHLHAFHTEWAAYHYTGRNIPAATRHAGLAFEEARGKPFVLMSVLDIAVFVSAHTAVFMGPDRQHMAIELSSAMAAMQVDGREFVKMTLEGLTLILEQMGFHTPKKLAQFLLAQRDSDVAGDRNFSKKTGET
jgi:hypothetical protein